MKINIFNKKKQEKKKEKIDYKIDDILISKKDNHKYVITNISYDINNYMAYYHITDKNHFNEYFFTYHEVLDYFYTIKESRMCKLDKLNNILKNDE